MKTSCSKCEYKWNYKGLSEFYATCPRCMSKVKIDIVKTFNKQIKFPLGSHE